MSPLQNPGNPNADLGLQMHVVDVPGVVDPATGVQLQHLLLYVPVRFDTDPVNPPTSSATQVDARVLLNNAAELWSPGHPASQAVTKAKRYALVPSDPTKRQQIITRIRTFFAESSRNAQLTLLLTQDNTTNQNARSFTNAGKITFDTTSIFFPDPPVVTPTRIVLFHTAVNRDKGATGGLGDSGDSVKSPFLTLAHELGHAVHGLVDEYVEELDTGAAFGPSFGRKFPFLPSFGQPDEGFSDWRPYYSDAASLLTSNHVPRLRHFWHHAKNLNESFKSSLRDSPYDLIHETFNTLGGAGLTYKVPPNNDKPPWLALFKDVQIPNGHGQVALFALGEDEGTVESMFHSSGSTPAGLAATNRMQGLLLVRSRICFVLDPSMTPKEQFDVLKTNFHSKIFDTTYAPKIRFMLVPGAPTTPVPALNRVAVLFQPHYSINPADAKNADIVFDISKSAAPPRPNPFLSKISAKQGTLVQVMATDFTFELAWRLVLGVATSAPGGAVPDLGVIRGTDLDGVARLLEQGLGEPSGFRQTLVYP